MTITADFDELVKSSFLLGPKSATQVLLKNTSGGLSVRNAGDTLYASILANLTAGAVDGVVVGGTTPAAGSFTTLKMTTGATVGNILTSDASGNATWGLPNYTIAQGRLTPSSGTPILSADVTGATTIYWTPYNGDMIGLYNGTSWIVRQFSETSLSLSGLVQNALYDIFAYDNAGTLTLEALEWTAPTTATITGCTNASPPVLTSTNTLVVDDIITIFGVGGATGVNGTFRVSAVTGTTITLHTLAGANPGAPGAYTSGGNWYKQNETTARATALVFQNGILCKSGALTRRYLGTIRIQPTSVGAGGQTEDSELNRYVYNHYNQVPKFTLFEQSSAVSYATAFRQMPNSTSRMNFVLGDTQSIGSRATAGLALSTGGAFSGYESYFGIVLDGIAAFDAKYMGLVWVNYLNNTAAYNLNSETPRSSVAGEKIVTAGYHYGQPCFNCTGANWVLNYQNTKISYLG